jgi:FKBP-type peptidyl-prolyl cis-trans isomerase FklB
MLILKKFLLASTVFLTLAAADCAAQKPKTPAKTDSKTPAKTDSKTPAKTDTKATTDKAAADQFSQAIGTAIAENLKSNGLKGGDINLQDMMDAMDKAFIGKPIMDINEAQLVVTNKINGLQAEKGKGEEAAGKTYLAENKGKSGVITTPSGLQYMVITKGSGAQPKLTDKVKVHYHGTLIDGKVFDSSVERGEPISFPLNGVIQGWQEGVQLMGVGSKFRFFIPHELAYGSRPAGQIPPYSTLIFDVELIGINVD